MRRGALAMSIVAVSATASASPLENHWHAAVPCAARPIVWRESFAWLSGDRVRRVSRGNGATQPAVPLPKWVATAHAPRLALALTHALVLTSDDRVAAIDPLDAKVVWHRDGVGDAGTALFAAAGPDLVLASAQHLERLDARTGTVAWTAELAGPVWLGSDDARIYALTAHGALAAFDLVTGARAWSAELGAVKPAQLAVGATLAVAAIPGTGVRVIELATGHARAMIALPAVATVTRDHAIATGGDRAFVTTIDSLSAVDLATGAVAWTQPLRAGAVLGATADVVYAVDAADIVYARDAATGAEAARYGAQADWIDDIASIVVFCSYENLGALDPLGAPVPITRVTLHGHVTCNDCTPDGTAPLPGVSIRIGDATTTSDASGRYVLPVTGRGSVRIELGNLPAGRAWDLRNLNFNFYQQVDGDHDISVGHR